MPSESWREVDCGSPRPPPCEKLSLTRIDRQRALLFGGKREKFSVGFNTVFILHLDTMVSSIRWISPQYQAIPARNLQEFFESVLLCVYSTCNNGNKQVL